MALTRRLCLVAIAVMLPTVLVLGGGTKAPAQTRCGQALLDGLPERLRAIEAQHPASADDALRRARELTDVVNAAAIANAPSQPCPGDGSAAEVRTLAHLHLIVLWAKMLALDAIDLPIYPTPYDRRCANVDGATWQLAFIRAYVERLDPQDSDASRTALLRALDDDPLAANVREAVAAHARRLRIGALPGPASDEAAWLQNNEAARSKAAALAAGLRCGALAGVVPLGQ